MAVPVAGAPPIDASAALVLEPATPGDWLVIAPTATALALGALLIMVRKEARLQASLGIAGLLLVALAAGALLWRVGGGGPQTMMMGSWLPPFGIAFTADLFGAALAFLASLVALAVAVYATLDIDQGLRKYGFYPFLALLIAGVTGAFLTGDIFNMYVWFEVLLIASFGLIVLGNRKEQLDGAIRYAVLNLVATTLFLIAVGYLYGALGTLNMADIALRLGEGPAPPGLAAIALLFVLAFGMKAAAFPVNFWLPASYHTPPAATAALFAGLLTKVGVYALIRTLALLMPGERAAYADLLSLIAVSTILVGSFGALAMSDIRRILGYTVIAGIGVVIAGLAVGTEAGLAGATLYMLHSMLATAGLYMAAGIAARVSASHELAGMGGIEAASPMLSALFLGLAFAVAGLPPFLGLWAKVAVTGAAFAEERFLLGAAVLMSGFFTTIALGRAFLHAFWRGGPQGTPDGETRPPPGDAAAARAAALIWPASALLLALLAGGLLPGPLFGLAERAASGLVSPAAYIGSVFGGSP